jgi:hypothetical protein
MKRRAAAVLAVGVGVTLAGCGGDDDTANSVAELDAAEILAQAQDALDAADTVSIVGSVEADGEQLELDLAYAPDGATGAITIQGFDLELLSVDGNLYMRGNAEMWDGVSGVPGAGALLADKYVLIPADDPAFADMAEFTDFSALTDELLTPEGEVTKGEETEIDGQPVIGLEDEDGSTLYIATTGDPLPVQVAPPEGEEGMLDFEWGVEVEVTAPDESEVVDLSELL